MEVSLDIVTSHEMMQIGLAWAGYDSYRQSRVQRTTNLTRFKSHYGSLPIVCAQIWEDLQTTKLPEARVERNYLDLKYFLLAMNWLYRYDTDEELSGTFGRCTKTLRKWKWFYVQKIAALKDQKVRRCTLKGRGTVNFRISSRFFLLPFTQIVWPDRWDPDHPDFDLNEIIFITVDGTLCPIHEVKTHPTMTKDPKYFSFKHNHAGLLYEVAMSIHEDKCVWIHGPIPGGETNDKGVFNRKLKAMIPPGMRALGDSGYAGDPEKVTLKYAQDSPTVRKFKRRALARHEKFNGRLKEFDCLSSTFHHNKGLHGRTFEAVAVINQYKMELGSPLFEGGV